MTCATDRLRPDNDIDLSGERMTSTTLRTAVLVLGALATLASSIAEAQWVLLARRAVGRVEQMSQSTPGNGATYDAASVIIDAPADKVFAVVAKRIKSAPGIVVARGDEVNRSLDFSRGAQSASIRVSALGDALAQLMVTSANAGNGPSPMPELVDHILAACKELNVECERAQK
jgi:hypothetical protein